MKRYAFCVPLAFWICISQQNDWNQSINIPTPLMVTSLQNEYVEPLLVKKSVLQKKVTMLIPQEFVVMDANTIAKKYPSVGHQPSEVYTNRGATINVALNHTKNAAKESDVEKVKKVMDAQFNIPSIDFIRSEIKVMHGKKFIVIEFVSQAVDTKIYNLMAITSLDDRLAMFTFNCTGEYRKDWAPIGKRIIESIQVTSTLN